MVHVLLTQKRENIYNVYIYIYNIQFLFGHFFHILGIWDIQEHWCIWLQDSSAASRAQDKKVRRWTTGVLPLLNLLSIFFIFSKFSSINYWYDNNVLSLSMCIWLQDSVQLLRPVPPWILCSSVVSTQTNFLHILGHRTLLVWRIFFSFSVSSAVWTTYPTIMFCRCPVLEGQLLRDCPQLGYATESDRDRK